ncbi:MAG: XylR N-terminal domain-containing protein [Polyangiaceae bacterium]|nr:XylR N-terminal domain-containing protein [Polyangiaceae bacterium]
MRVSDIDLSTMLSFEPEAGRVLLRGERYLLFRQEAFLALRKLLFEQLGEPLSRSILTQFGYRCGQGDYLSLTTHFAWDTEDDRIAAGPVMHTWEGLVRADPTFLEHDRRRGHFHMKGTWRNSYEAELHMKLFGRAEAPVCHTLTGYASGWATAFIGFPVVAIEPSCAARGDETCTFHIQPLNAWGPEADPWKHALTSTSSSLSKELEQRLATIEQQAAAIRALSTPVLEVWDEILVLPIIGRVDAARSADLMVAALEAISGRKARCVILDVTGLEIVDSCTVQHLVQVAQATGLLGARCVLTGVRPDVARALVSLDADLSAIVTLRSLKEGLRYGMSLLQEHPGPQGPPPR